MGNCASTCKVDDFIEFGKNILKLKSEKESAITPLSDLTVEDLLGLKSGRHYYVPLEYQYGEYL